MSQFFASGGPSIGVSASASVLQWIFRTDFLAVQGTLKSLLQHHSWLDNPSDVKTSAPL